MVYAGRSRIELQIFLKGESEVKNTILDLNNYLFEELERITDDSLTDVQRERAISRAEAVTKLADTIIRNADVALKAAKLAADTGAEPSALPRMLGGAT